MTQLPAAIVGAGWCGLLAALAMPAFVPAPAAAQGASPADTSLQVAAPAWEFQLSGLFYLLPDDEDYVQPTLRADRGRVHLEARYNYEDLESASFFAGANFALGDETWLSLTPMIGFVVGQTDGVIPALEADFTFRRFEAYGEAEYVLDVEDSSSNYFYMWSELSYWPTEWLRAGLVAQRTQIRQEERDLQRGVLLGVSVKRVEGVLYSFNPGSDGHFAAVSLGVSF